MSFKKVEDEIRPLLKDSEAARGDDMTLYAAYVFDKVQAFNLGASWLQRVFSDRRFRITHGIAPYETVSRVRRKLQENDESLRPSKEYIEEKKRAERDYKAYARQKGGKL